MIVETVKHGECTCHFDDSAYVNRTEEEIEKTIQIFSAFLAECLRKKEISGDVKPPIEDEEKL